MKLLEIVLTETETCILRDALIEERHRLRGPKGAEMSEGRVKRLAVIGGLIETTAGWLLRGGRRVA